MQSARLAAYCLAGVALVCLFATTSVSPPPNRGFTFEVDAAQPSHRKSGQHAPGLIAHSFSECTATAVPPGAHKPLFRHATTDRPSSYPYITGDTIRSFADHVFDETTDAADWAGRAASVKHGDIVFLKTDYMARFFGAVFPRAQHAFVLATHNSDFGAPAEFSSFLDDPKLLAWYAINPDTVHPKLTAMPLSFANAYWPHGSPAALQDAFDAGRGPWRDRKHGVYVNMDTGTNHAVRSKALTQASGLQDVHVRHNRANYSDYLADVVDSKFVLCPPGNGVDSHRTWEAVLLGAVPIVEASLLNPLYSGLPVVVVQRWDDVTDALLQSVAARGVVDRHCVPRVLSADYWLARMLRHRASTHADKPGQGVPLPETSMLPSVSMRPGASDGQVRIDTEFGMLLFQLAARPDVNRVLEIGTWKGGGSSLCIARGLNMHRHRATQFVTVETNADRRAIASQTLAPYPFVKCLLGTAVDHTKVATHDQVAKFYERHPQLLLPGWEAYRLGEEKESSLFAGQHPVVDQYCGRDPAFDMIFLDGGEFYGRAEFAEVLAKCRPRIIALHDTVSFKNYDARDALLRMNAGAGASGYRLVKESRQGTGYAVFEKE